MLVCCVTDTAVCTCSCAALDNLVSRLFRILNRSPTFMNGEVPSFSERHRDVIESQREQHFLQVMRERPAILQKVRYGTNYVFSASAT